MHRLDQISHSGSQAWETAELGIRANDARHNGDAVAERDWKERYVAMRDGASDVQPRARMKDARSSLLRGVTGPRGFERRTRAELYCRKRGSVASSSVSECVRLKKGDRC